MKDYPRLTAESCVDTEAECLYRYVYGANDVFYPHCHDFYEIFITVSGIVTHFINGITQKLPEGSLVFIRPDDVHAYIYDTPHSTKTAYINFTFNKETATSLFSYLSDSFPSDYLLSCDMPPTITLSNIEKERLLKVISELNIIYWSDKCSLKLKMRVILADIFVRFFSNLSENSQETLPVWLSQLLSDMELHENFTAGFERMVSLSNKSREHLSRSIKKYCKITASEYINDLRLNYASNLLLNTNKPILEICFACGFQSVSYFYKVFKIKYTCSPSEFRSNYKTQA